MRPGGGGVRTPGRLCAGQPGVLGWLTRRYPTRPAECGRAMRAGGRSPVRAGLGRADGRRDGWLPGGRCALTGPTAPANTHPAGDRAGIPGRRDRAGRPGARDRWSVLRSGPRSWSQPRYRARTGSGTRSGPAVPSRGCTARRAVPDRDRARTVPYRGPGPVRDRSRTARTAPVPRGGFQPLTGRVPDRQNLARFAGPILTRGRLLSATDPVATEHR